MKKALFTLLSICFLLAPASHTEAATVRAKLIDAETKEALRPNGSMEAYRKLDDGSWQWAESVSVWSPNTEVTFTNLEAGMYHFKCIADNYITEYYNNTTNPDARTEITLAADATRNLGTISLRPLPVRLENPSVFPEDIPSSGGRITGRTDVVNSTRRTRRVRVWPTVTIVSTAYGLTHIHDSFDLPPKLVEVPARGRKTLNFSINVPAEAPNRQGIYYVDFEASEESRWQPVAVSIMGGWFYKGDDSQ